MDILFYFHKNPFNIYKSQLIYIPIYLRFIYVNLHFTFPRKSIIFFKTICFLHYHYKFLREFITSKYRVIFTYLFYKTLFYKLHSLSFHLPLFTSLCPFRIYFPNPFFYYNFVYNFLINSLSSFLTNHSIYKIPFYKFTS